MLNRFQEGSGLAATTQAGRSPCLPPAWAGLLPFPRRAGRDLHRLRAVLLGIPRGMQEPTLMEINDQPITFMKHVQP